MRFTFLSLLFLVLLASCEDKGYELNIDSYNKEIRITMPPPALGVAGLGRISWKVDIDKIEEDIFNELRKYKHAGTYIVKLSSVTQDRYGQTHVNEIGNIGILDVDNVKKYAEYKYFRGQITSMILEAFVPIN